MKNNNNKGWLHLLKNFSGQCPERILGGRRPNDNFNAMTSYQEAHAVTDRKVSQKYKFMLYEEFIEAAQTAAFGKFSAKEAHD